MKARSMVCADVAMSDGFLSMTLEAQLLYFLLLFDADVCGRIYGADRICRGYGFDADALEELYENGYLLHVDGLTVDRHCWRNNTLDGRLKGRMDSFEAFASGRIGFEGEPFKSSYRLNDVATTEERRNNDGATTPNATQQQRQPNNNDNLNPTTTESQPQPQPQRQRAGESGAPAQEEGKEGTNMHPCQCPRCKSTEATFTLDAEGSTIRCPVCGEFRNERPNRPSRLNDWRVAG